MTMGDSAMSGNSLMDRNFNHLLHDRWGNGYFTCVGLDVGVAKIPPHLHVRNRRDELNVYRTILAFVGGIIDTTHDYVCMYKPNYAFFEQYGPAGLMALKKTVEMIHERAPKVPVMIDAKRADIGTTNDGSVEAIFGYFQADAVTINPYFGCEAVAPFLRCKDKGIFVLCRTSNPGANEFQDLVVNEPDGPLYKAVAEKVSRVWNVDHNCGLVVGATAPTELEIVRRIAPKIPILIPGVGAQGGGLAECVQAGKTAAGQGFIINSSRSVIYASSGTDYADAAAREVMNMNKTIATYLQ